MDIGEIKNREVSMLARVQCYLLLFGLCNGVSEDSYSIIDLMDSGVCEVPIQRTFEPFLMFFFFI